MRTVLAVFAAVLAKAIQDFKKTAGANERATTNFMRLIYLSLKA